MRLFRIEGGHGVPPLQLFCATCSTFAAKPVGISNLVKNDVGRFGVQDQRELCRRNNYELACLDLAVSGPFPGRAVSTGVSSLHETPIRIRWTMRHKRWSFRVDCFLDS